MTRDLQQRLEQAADVHRENIRKSLVRRYNIARDKKDENLLRQLLVEINYYE